MLATASSTHFSWSVKLSTFIMVNVLDALDGISARGLSFKQLLIIN